MLSGGMGEAVSIAYRKDREKLMTDFTMHRRALKCIAQGALTNSKRPQSLIMGVYPTHIKKARGCHVWDHTGRKYIDFITGLGTNLLGYANDTVNTAAISALQEGNVYSMGSEREITTAEKLKDIFPFVDAWKFLKTGSEACAAAVRIARAATGRDWILSEGYHGWSDDFVSMTPPACGVAPKIRCIDQLKYHEIDDSVAAVIVEPVITDMSPERMAWLHQLREMCTKAGALLIFDEIITGFRFPKFSVSNYFGIVPDLICLGKAMANGFPLSAVGGKYAVMSSDDYFVSSTFAGCVDALAACAKVIDLLKSSYNIDELWKQGAEFQKQFNSIWPEKIQIEGYPTRGIFKGDEDIKALFMQEACFAGMLFGPSPWYNFPLSKEFGLIETIKDIFNNIKSGKAKLVGEPPQSPFAQKVRG